MKEDNEIILSNPEKDKSYIKGLIFLSLIGVVFLYLILKVPEVKGLDLIRKFLEPYTGPIESFLIVLITFILTYLFIGFTKRIIRKYLARIGRNKKSIKLFLLVYEYFMWILVIILTFSVILKQGASLITSIGLIGFGLTLALQKPILNFVGWITIIFGKTYHIGDTISINQFTGKVYDIRIMYTYLGELNQEGDPTGRAVFVPNEFVFTNPITNYSKGTPLIWDCVVIHLPYSSNWKKAIKIMEKTIRDYYDKKIKNDIKSIFNGDIEDYKKIVTRINAHERGITIKIRYLVEFDKSNDVKRELTEILLDKIRSSKDISLGKTESVT